MAVAGRKTTIEERREIVKYCIEHNRNYKETAGIYDVSYSQVYSWVKKYDANGEEALTDKRGCHKTDDELELLHRENARLKRKLEEKDMLAELLKKCRNSKGCDAWKTAPCFKIHGSKVFQRNEKIEY